MSFQNPAALLLLLLVPLVILLHALNVRFRERSVSTLMFWRRALADRRTSFRLRRILRDLLLLLQVLAVAAMALGLAGPVLTGVRDPAGGDLVLVLDVSAGMKTREGTGTRFDLARARALEELSSLRDADRAVLVLAGSRPEPAGSFSADREETVRQVRAARPTDEPGDPAAALRLALSLCGPGAGARISFVTDGAFEEPEGFADVQTPLKVLRVGSAGRNLGLTAFRIRRLPADGTGYRLFVAADSCSPQEEECGLRVLVEGTEAYATRLRFPPRGEARVSVPWTGPLEGRVTAELDARDDFPVDDRAYAVLARARSLRVLLATAGNPFLESLLSAFPNCAVTRVGTADGVPAGGAFDIEVFDGIDPPPLGPGAYVLIATAPPDLPVRAAGTVVRPQDLSWDRAHPLLASVDLEGLWVADALRLEPGAGMEPVLSSASGPLILSYDQGGLRALLIAFDLRRSDLPLRPALPLFWANVLTWLSPDWLSVTASEARTGEPVTLAVGGRLPTGASATVLRPDGRRDAVRIEGETFTCRDCDQAGFYSLESGAGIRRFAVNLLSPGESDIRPRWEPGERRAAPGAAEDSEAASATAGRSGIPLWNWLALAAAVLILGEWAAWIKERR